jgi:hypothetical protein
MKRTQTYEGIKPLIDLCKAGKLFDVQEWISAGKPVNPPPSEKGYRRKSPLEIAMDCGFHSLVQVLLEGGAAIEEPRYSAIYHALSERRLDLVQLLINHGADIHSVNMGSVFDTWQPEIMEFFIERGADVETGNPLAYALCNRIRTALRILKGYGDRFPSFKEQANIALRHHCKEGNLKWVSLMLWAGADPYAKGPDSWDDEPDPDEDLNALEFAALYENFDVFKLKQIRLDPNHPDSQGILRKACRADNCDFLKELLDKGFSPSEQEDRGTSLVQSLLCSMSRYSWSYDDLFSRRPERNIDNSRSREKIKMIHLLARHGAKWLPSDRTEINEARRSLLKMSPDYTVEFIWIMSKYNATTREKIEDLIRTPTIRALLYSHLSRIVELIETLPPAEAGACLDKPVHNVEA